MKRREFIGKSAAAAGLAAMSGLAVENIFSERAASSPKPGDDAVAPPIANPLQAPAKGIIPVAFVISSGAVMIDFAGPWQVFQDVMVPSRGPTMEDQMPFQLYTVSDNTKPVTVSGGLKIQPDYRFDNAPAPKVIVIPAQNEPSKAMLNWITASSRNADVTMSVCTGAFILAKTGLLNGKAATTYHGAFRSLAVSFPEIQVKRGARFVDVGNLATAGGLSSGIDLALHVVERYFGRTIARNTAFNMEYQGQGWMNPDSNAVYAVAAVSTDEHPLCPVCTMEVDPAIAPKSTYKNQTYYFCSKEHQTTFDAAPEKWLPKAG